MNKVKNINMLFLMLFLLINCSVAIQVNTQSSFLQLKQQPDIHHILIFGNIGEIEYYRNQTNLSENLNDEEKETYYEKNIFTQKYKTNGLSCKIQDKDLNSIDLLEEKGLINFQTIFNDQVVREFVKESEEVLFLGNTINPEYSELSYKNSYIKNEKNLQFFESRIKCGWNIFINILKKAKLAQVSTNQNEEIIKISDKINFSKGKFSQLINMDLEDTIVNNFTKFEDEKTGHEGKVKTEGFSNVEITDLNNTSSKSIRFSLSKTPVITTIVYSEFTLQIIDFDSNILACLANDDDSDYKICSRKSSFSYLSFEEASRYAFKLNTLLNKKIIKSERGNQVWKIMRAYHAPLYNHRRSNRFYFKNITAMINGESITFNIWESIKKNLINIFFSASDNNTSLNIIPYSLDDFVETKFSCFRKKYADVGCYYYKKSNDKIEFSQTPLTMKNCNNDMFYKLPYKAYSNKLEENFLYVFNVGNSGTYLEKLDYGYTANAFLFWARAQEDFLSKKYIHGCTYTTFTKDFIEISFMETQVNQESNSTRTYKAATFRVTESDIPDQKKFNQHIKENICKDFLVIGRKGSI